MTLFEKLKDIIGLGYSVNFSSTIAFQFEITVERDGDEIKSAMPIRDHFSESKIISCIEWSILKLDNDATISSENKICDGCCVRKPFEHRCHGIGCNCDNLVCMEKQGRITIDELRSIVSDGLKNK